MSEENSFWEVMTIFRTNYFYVSRNMLYIKFALSNYPTCQPPQYEIAS